MGSFGDDAHRRQEAAIRAHPPSFPVTTFAFLLVSMLPRHLSCRGVTWRVLDVYCAPVRKLKGLVLCSLLFRAHSRKDLQGDRQVRQTSLELEWKYHRQHILFPRILQQNLLQTNQDESTIYSLIVRKTRIAKHADARKLRWRHAK